jgi:hypothetical protein
MMPFSFMHVFKLVYYGLGVTEKERAMKIFRACTANNFMVTPTDFDSSFR